MLFVLIILYVITLVYISITERYRNYASLIGLQGWTLLGIALLRLHSIDFWELGFIIAETLIFKAIIVPAILFSIIRRTGINRISNRTGGFNSLLLSILFLGASGWIAYLINDSRIDMVFFAVALYALFSGLLLIVSHRRIFSHLVGFLMVENGVFLFSIALGVEMPFLINIAILLDIIISVLMLSMFINKIGDKLHDLDSDTLTTIKD